MSDLTFLALMLGVLGSFRFLVGWLKGRMGERDAGAFEVASGCFIMLATRDSLGWAIALLLVCTAALVSFFVGREEAR